MNPLLNRIYESKNRKQSKGPKQLNSSVDKVLVPKLNPKTKLQSLLGSESAQRQINTFIKPYIGRLPSLHKQKLVEDVFQSEKKTQMNKSKGGFRSRRLSSQIRDNQTSLLREGDVSLQFPSEHKLNFEGQKELLFQLPLQRRKTMSKQVSSMFTEPYLQDNLQRQKKQKQVTLQSINNYDTIQPKVTQFKTEPKRQQNQEDEQDELFEYLNVLQTNPDLNEEFCYMNRGQKPYSFYIVDYQERNLNEYLTVSLRGITYYKIQNQEADNEFFTIPAMTKDIQKYKFIKKIPFFKNYVIQKALNHWKISMFKKKFINQCEYLKENLFSQNQINLTFFQKLHALFEQCSKGNFFEMSIFSTLPTLNEFKEKNLVQRKKEIDQNCGFFEKETRQGLLQCLRENMIKFRRQKRVTLGTSDKLEKSESFLPFDNKKKTMKFTQLAKLKQFEGYLYKIVKYTDMVRYNFKIEYIKSSLSNSTRQMVNLLSNYQNRNSRAFISWIQCQTLISQEVIQQNQQIAQQSQESSFLTSYNKVQKTSSKINSGLKNSKTIKGTVPVIRFSPSVEEIKESFLSFKEQCIKDLWNSHQYFAHKKDEFLCTQYELESQQLPTKLDLKYYLQKTPELIQLNFMFEKSLLNILQKLSFHKDHLTSKVLKIYIDSFLKQPIENYLQNERLKQYLDNYLIDKEIIQQTQQEIQFGLVLLRVQNFKTTVKKLYQQKYKTIITAIPQQVLKRTQLLARQVRDIYFKFKQNPSTIREFIDFYRVFHQEVSKLDMLQKRIENLLELQTMIQSNGIKVPESSRAHIAESQTLFRQLSKRFEEIEENQEKERKKFEISIDAMIPQIQQKSQDLFKEIEASDLVHNPSSEINKVLDKLSDYSIRFEKIKNKKEELFLYQIELNLGHKELQNYFKLQVNFDWFIKLWNGHKEFLEIQTVTKQKGYGQIQNLETQSLTRHLRNIENAETDIQSVELLQQFKQKTNRLLNVIRLARLIATQTLQPQHCEQIRNIMVFTSKRIKDLLFTRQGSRTINCEDFYVNTNISQIEDQVTEIAFLSAQQNIIKKKLTEIEQFWKKNKVKFINEDIIGNGAPILHLDQNEELHQKIGLFNLSLKNIESSGQAKGPVLQKLQIHIKTTVYLRKLLFLWGEVQRQWLKLLPMMTTCPSVKHQSNVYFEFTSVDQKMRKLIKQVSDMSSMRKLVEDYVDRKNINILQNCGSQLKLINKTFQNFLQAKRATYNRFYFLTDQQLVSIIENVKDSKSMAKYGGYCFNCDELDMDNDLINGLQTENQIFRLRKMMLRGEPDQMFKSISENMKNSMKFGIRNLVPKMKISTNIEQELRQNSLQVCLLADLLTWTQMTEIYLNSTSYDEYQLITKRPAEQMARLLPKVSKDLLIKVGIRLCQAMHLKEISESLIQDQVTKNDFKWKQQMKFFFEEDQIVIRQFDRKITYGLQYYPPQKIFIPTLNTERLMYQSYYACLNYKILSIKSNQGEGKRNLIKHTASRIGVYHKEVVCNSNLKINYLMRFVQGAIQAGAWLSFYESSNLKNQVAYELLDNIEKLRQQEKCHPRTLFMIVNHQYEYEKISMFKYHNYSMVEPDHSKICEYLLQMYRFRQWEQLSKKILSYLKTIKPLMENIMGSHLSLVRKIVDGAGQKKMNSKNSQNENEMVVEMIQKEIIHKSEQNVALLLRKALVCYFNTDEQIVDPKKQYDQKLSVLKNIIKGKQSKNILVIGNRSCKSTLINQAVSQLNLQAVKLFPQAQTQFLTPFSIDNLNLIPPDNVLIYDGDHVVSEFTDIITSGYLLIEGKKVVIRQKIILQLRNIQNCTPSFIENCQVIYVGNVVSKAQKFLKHCPIDKKGDIWPILEEIFGQDLIKMHQNQIQSFAKLIYRYRDISQTRSVHKIIIWFLSVLNDEQIWQRNYAGKYTDFTVHEKFLQLVPVDATRASQLRYNESNFYFVPTKASVLITQLTNSLLNIGLHVQIFGNQQIGKTSLIRLLKGTKVNLSVYNKTQYWSQYIKDKLLIVRKDAKNFLLPIGDSPYKIIIDDVDLGNQTHTPFVRGLIQAQEMRDSKYHRYFLEQFHIVLSSRSKNFNNKVDETLVKIPLFPQSKQSLTTIFLVNADNFVKSHNMNRQVIDYFERTVLKAFLIAYDDFSNLYTCNIGTALLISTLKELLSLPKKNAFISVEDFSSLFKSIFYQKIVEKSFNKKLKWQLNSVYENITKIIFNNDAEWSHWVNIDSQYKKTPLSEVQTLIKSRFSNIISYPEMIQKIIVINNQLQSLNPKIAIVGRKGVGKKHLAKISASFNRIETVQTLRDAIFNSLKNNYCVLVEEVKRNSVTMYQQLNECQIDGDLQRFLELHDKEKFRQSMNTSEGFESTQIITKIKKYVKNIILIDDKHEYLKVCDELREFNEFSVCILDEWPIEAIVNIYKTVDGNERIHAQIFGSANEILFQNGQNFMSMAFYEKYIQVFSTVYQTKKSQLQQKKDNLTKMYNKFNESCTVIRQWQQKIGSLQSEITEMIEDLSKHIQIDKLNATITMTLTKQASEKEAQIKQKKDTLEQSKNQMEVEVKITKRILDRIQKIINSLQRTEMSELKKIYKTNKLVEFGLECLCILLKEKDDDVSQKTINKLLADPNLLMKMKSPDILAIKNMYLASKFKKELPQHQNLLKTHTTETSKILVEWVRAIIEYWETTELHNQKRHIFKQLQESYNSVAGDYEKTLQELKNLKQKTRDITQQLTRLQKEKADKQHEFLTLNKRLENSSEVIPILLKAQEQIEQILRKVNLFLNNLIGNTVLLASTATFLPLKRLSIKSKLLDSTKKILKKNYIPYSDSFLHQVISQDIFINDFDEEFNNIQNLNIFIIQNFPSRLKIIIDPERKAFNYLENYQNKTLHHIIDRIVEKADDLKAEEFKSLKIYHSTSENLQIQAQKCLIIDWKTIETNPEERLFNRIAFAKKPEYFEAKNELTQKVEDNLKKIEQMKNELYTVICKSALKILQDQKFLQNGKKLIQLQGQTKKIQEEIKGKIDLIHNLQKQIKSEVNSIFILLRHFKEIRPIGLDLILDAASKQGDSIQNVISWALTNLSPEKRTGYLLAVAHQFNGKVHEQLLKQIIVNAPLKSIQVKIKKPSLVSVSNWQKLLKISGYSQDLKQLVDMVQKHQKQFESWINNYSLILPPNLTPENLSINEHLFVIYHLKPKVFPQSIDVIIRRSLIKYEIKELKNSTLFSQTNQLYPVVYHCSIFKLEKMCEQLNASKMEKVRLGSIKSQSEMKKRVWKCMQHSEWLVLYGITSNLDMDWLEKIVYYVLNYQKNVGFRVIILPDDSESTKKKNQNFIQTSKFLTSISIHMYEEPSENLELMKYFELYNETDLSLTIGSIKQKTHSVLIEEQNAKTPRLASRSKTRKGSMKESGHQKIVSLLNLQKASSFASQLNHQLKGGSLLSLPQISGIQNNSFVLATKGNDKFLNRLYKHMLLAHLVISRRFSDKFQPKSFEILKRSMQLLKYIEQNTITIEFNVENIIGYLVKLYSNELPYDERKCMEEIMQRIVDQSKFNEKNIFGVNIANFTSVQAQLQNNAAILGTDESIFVRQAIQKCKKVMKVLDQMFDPLDIKQETVFLRIVFGKIPILLSNKEVFNENYHNFYFKQQKLHNDLIRRTQNLINWINTYSNKSQNGEQIEPENQYNWPNLMRQIQKLVGFKFNRNRMRDVVTTFTLNLKKSHDFLLYFNSSLTSFTVDPTLVSNFQALISTYTINYLSTNNIRDSFNYVPNLQFKKVSNNAEMTDIMLHYGIDGIVLNNLSLRDFKWNNEFRQIQPIVGDFDGEQKAPIVVYKLRKLFNSQKEDEEIVVNMVIKEKTRLRTKQKERILMKMAFMCNSVYPEFYMRDNCLVLEDITID